MATLGFLNDKSFNEAKDYYKKVLVEDMKNLLVSEYKRMGPQSCDLYVHDWCLLCHIYLKSKTPSPLMLIFHYV